MTISQEVPLNPTTLLEVLQAATSQNQAHIQLGSAQLKAWETTSGYWSLLQDAFLDTKCLKDVRWLAIITIKNGVQRFWGKHAKK